MNETMINDEIIAGCQAAKQAEQVVAQLSSDTKKQLLLSMADALLVQADKLVAVNQQEVFEAQSQGLDAAFIDRLTLNHQGVTAMATGMRAVANSADPVGRVLASWQVESGLTISRVAVPLGVIAMIYESRPNVTADAAALCLQAGNAVILRGGSECAKTNRAIANVLQAVLQQYELPTALIQMIAIQDRSAIEVLLQQNRFVDVLIPRGGQRLIEYVNEHSRIPVLSHLAGLCHTYIHEQADADMAVSLVLNAKMRRPGICGATETVLIDASVAATILPLLVAALVEAGCEVRGDLASQQSSSQIQPANDDDWKTEYLAAIVSIKVVENLAAALAHIAEYGSGHTDAIITEDQAVAQQFCAKVNSAIAMHNCSTQFADGGEFGMGAEIGIATGRLHARGPVGAEQLTTFKYVVSGQGQLRA